MTQWVARAQAAHFHLIGGNLARASEENDRAFEYGLEIGAPDAASWWGGIGAMILWCRDGRMVEPELAGQMADEFPGALSWRMSQALALAEHGRLDECRALMADHGLTDPELVPKDLFWFVNVFSLRGIVRLSGDEDVARAALASFAPYADAVVHYCIGLNGPMRHFLALFRAVSGDIDGGIADGRLAVDWMATAGSPIHLTAIRIEFAELLVRRHTAADLAEARTLVEVALADARQFDMSGWITRGDRLLSQLG